MAFAAQTALSAEVSDAPSERSRSSAVPEMMREESWSLHLPDVVVVVVVNCKVKISLSFFGKMVIKNIMATPLQNESIREQQFLQKKGP